MNYAANNIASTRVRLCIIGIPVRNIFLSIISFLLFGFFGDEIKAQTPQPDITVNYIAPTSVCAGSTVIITFAVTDGAAKFGFGTQYTAYLSNNLGTNFISIGNFTPTSVGLGNAGYTPGAKKTTDSIKATVTIPAATSSGLGYKISVGSINPTFDGSGGAGASPAFTINALPNAPASTGNSRCGSGTVTISATPGAGETIDWYASASGGTPLLSGNSSYTTPSLSSTTTYYAEARNSTTGCISSTRTPVIATINSAPVITTQPSSQTICIGASVTFNVIASGTPSPTYQWRKNGLDMAGATGSSYTIGSVAASDAGSYDVVVTNSCSSVTSSTAALSNYSSLIAGSFTTTSVTACVNYNPGTLTISGTSGGLAPYTYQWQMSTNGGAFTNVVTGNPYNPSNLTVAGTYVIQCVVSDACGTNVTTTTKTITIVADPTVSISGGTTVCQAGSLILTANVSGGTGSNNYQWQSGTSSTGPWTDISGATSSTYSLATATSGIFYYKIKITGGAACSQPTAITTITVNPKPTPIITHN